MLLGFIQTFKKLENWGRWMAPAFINSIGGIVNTTTTTGTHNSHAFLTLPCARHPSLSAVDAVKGLRLQLLATGVHDESITCHGHRRRPPAAHNHAHDTSLLFYLITPTCLTAPVAG